MLHEDDIRHAAVLEEDGLVGGGGALGHLAAPLLLGVAPRQLHADLPEPGREHALANQKRVLR